MWGFHVSCMCTCVGIHEKAWILFIGFWDSIWENFKKRFNFYYFLSPSLPFSSSPMCAYVCVCVYMWICAHECRCSQRLYLLSFPWAQVTGYCELPNQCRYQELNLDPLKEQYMLLTIDPSLKYLSDNYFYCIIFSMTFALCEAWVFSLLRSPNELVLWIKRSLKISVGY